MSRRTSSEFDLNQFKRKASMQRQNVKVSMSTREMIAAPVVENQIQLTEKSSSFKTACSLILNRLPIKKPIQEMIRTPKDFLKIQDRAELVLDINSQIATESNIIPHASALTFSYTSDSSPVASNDIIAPEKTMQRKRDPLEIEGQLRQIQNVGKRPMRVAIKDFIFCPKDSRVELVKYYSYFAKRHILFSELLIALAFGLPYSFLDRNDLLVLLIINCLLIYTIVQMKKRYAILFHSTCTILTMIIHQTMLIFLNNAFALDEINVSTTLLLIFSSSSLIGITSLPTILTILYCFVLKISLFYYSNNDQLSDISQLAMAVFITFFSSFIAVVTSLRNVNSCYSNGLRMIKMEAVIEKADLDVNKLDSIAASLLPDYVWRELKEGRHGAFTGNINKGLRYEYPKASMIFADVVGFTVLSSKIDKDELLKILNHIFTRFDKIAELHDMEKVKTVGDCYVAVGGITTNSEDCAARCAFMGLKMVEAMKEIQKSEIIPNGIVVALRIGAHVGSATGGLIGETKMIFDIWSKDVSIAGQMEQSGMANRLHISQPFLDDIKSFAVVEDGPGIVFQNQKIQTYFLKSITVNNSLLKSPFIKKLCTMGKMKARKPILEKSNQYQKTEQYAIHAIQMIFNEAQLENEYNRKNQKNSLLMNITSILLNLVLTLCFGALALLYTEFHLAIISVLSLVIGLHMIIAFAFFSAYFKNTVVFEGLSYAEKQFFKLGSIVQSYDLDQVFLFLLIQIYSMVMVYGFINAYALVSVHNSFYICIISGFIFQNIKFVYFVSYCTLVLASYVYCVSISGPTHSEYLLVIFYFACFAICLLNNYTCNFMRRHFYRSEIINKDKMYTLQDQLFKTNKTVLKLLPPHVTEMLKSGQVEFSESFPQCAVIFCEIIGVANYPQNPDLLNEIISRIDKSLCLYPGVDKVKTIYSVYMAASGITPESRAIDKHIESGLDFANSLKKQLSSLRNTGYNLSLKVGISIGPVIGGIVGKSKLTYDIWGDTVNISSRMESTAELQMIQTTQSVYHLYKDKYKFEDRGPIHVKGKGIMNTYVLGSKKRFKRDQQD